MVSMGLKEWLIPQEKIFFDLIEEGYYQCH